MWPPYWIAGRQTFSWLAPLPCSDLSSQQPSQRSYLLGLPPAVGRRMAPQRCSYLDPQNQ